MTLTPKNWGEFQHYKDRAPSWIKLHRGLLDDYDFARLPLASRALAPMLWLLASEYERGEITASHDEMAFRLRMSEDDLHEALNPLLDKGFFLSDSKPLAGDKRCAIPEREKERELETEKNIAREARLNVWPVDYEQQFWKAYPKRVDKAAALKKLKLVWRSDRVPWGVLISAVQRYAQLVRDPQYTKSPLVWLNKGCWDDEVPDTSAVQPAEVPGQVHVMKTSEDWGHFAAHWRSTKGREPPTDKRGGWWFPAEWKAWASEAAE